MQLSLEAAGGREEAVWERPGAKWPMGWVTQGDYGGAGPE